MNASPEWWKDFFSGLVVEFWRHVLPEEVTRAEAGFLKTHLALAPGARVLDVPCGHGRLALELTAAGYRVTGVDRSREMLEAAREAAGRRGLAGAVSWRLSDMRDLPRDGGFEGAFCAGSSFGYFGDEGDAEFLRAVTLALVPGGRFVLDGSKAAECLFPAFRERHDMTTGGLRFEAENRYDPRQGTIENRYTITRLADGSAETRLARHRVYTASQLCSMVEAAGLEVLELFGSADGSPYRLGSPQLFLVTRRSPSRESRPSARG